MAVTRLFVAPNVPNEALLCVSSLYLLVKFCRSEAPGVISSDQNNLIAIISATKRPLNQNYIRRYPTLFGVTTSGL
jgi:hypothetical protein